MNKRFRRILLWSGGIFTTLVIILLVHIVIMVKAMPKLTHPTVQLGRADFSEFVDPGAAGNIQREVAMLPGVTSTYYNKDSRTLVYAFDNRLNSAQKIYDDAIKNCGVHSKRYVVLPGDAAKGCPVMDDNTISGKVTQFISGIVN